MSSRRGNFWRIISECWKRSIAPLVVYVLCSLTALACQNIGNEIAKITLTGACLLFAAFLNFDLAARCGKRHYRAYLTGNLRRSLEKENPAQENGDTSLEYRLYKGFLTGLLIDLPMIIVCLCYALFFRTAEGWTVAGAVLLVAGGWCVVPWSAFGISATPVLVFVGGILPILTTGIGYPFGAKREEKTIDERNARMQAVSDRENAEKTKRKNERRV